MNVIARVTLLGEYSIARKARFCQVAVTLRVPRIAGISMPEEFLQGKPNDPKR